MAGILEYFLERTTHVDIAVSSLKYSYMQETEGHWRDGVGVTIN